MNDFLLEKRLMTESPDLHKRISDTVVVLQTMLDSFLSWFPSFTDHSALHSMDVLAFCNELLGDQINNLTIQECYVLVMSCYMHDMGMGISKEDYKALSKKLKLDEYRTKHPNASDATIIRDFHNEFSGLFLMKYADFFEIPSDDLMFAIVQVSRGHRKTDLFDEKEYPDLHTPDGVVRTSYLAAMIRLADEIDVGADRNPELLFDTSTLTDQADIDAFGTHESIRTVEVAEDSIILHVKPKEPRFVGLVEDLAKKVQHTLDYCREVAEKRSELKITQKDVKTVPIQ